MCTGGGGLVEAQQHRRTMIPRPFIWFSWGCADAKHSRSHDQMKFRFTFSILLNLYWRIAKLCGFSTDSRKNQLCPLDGYCYLKKAHKPWGRLLLFSLCSFRCLHHMNKMSFVCGSCDRNQVSDFFPPPLSQLWIRTAQSVLSKAACSAPHKQVHVPLLNKTHYLWVWRAWWTLAQRLGLWGEVSVSVCPHLECCGNDSVNVSFSLVSAQWGPLETFPQPEHMSVQMIDKCKLNSVCMEITFTVSCSKSKTFHDCYRLSVQ